MKSIHLDKARQERLKNAIARGIEKTGSPAKLARYMGSTSLTIHSWGAIHSRDIPHYQPAKIILQRSGKRNSHSAEALQKLASLIGENSWMDMLGIEPSEYDMVVSHGGIMDLPPEITPDTDIFQMIVDAGGRKHLDILLLLLNQMGKDKILDLIERVEAKGGPSNVQVALLKLARLVVP